MMKYFYLIIFGIALCATLYYNGMNILIAKYIAMTLLGFLCVIALLKKGTIVGGHPIFRKWLIWLFLADVVNVIYGINPFNETITMSLAVAFASFHLLDFPRDKLSMYMLPICIFGAYCAIQSVLSGIGAFVVSEFYDDNIAKNQIGAAFSAMAIISTVFALENKSKVIRILYSFLAILSLYPAVFFTCRTALITYTLVALYMLYNVYKWKGILMIPILVILVSICSGNELQELLYNSIVGRRNINDIDDLSSGRVTQALVSLQYFFDHPFTGFYGSSDGINLMPPNAHIFILYRITKWGIIGSIPYLVLYFSIFKIWIYSIKKQNTILMGTLALAFLESFSEYAPPFGPGSCFIIIFALIGYCLRQEVKINNS